MKPAYLALVVLWACGGGESLSTPDAPSFVFPDGFGAGQADPAGFTATLVSPTQIALSWQAAPGAFGYVLERKVGSGTLLPLPVTNPTLTAFDDTDVEAGNTYTYLLQAIGTGGISPGVQRTVSTGGGPAATDSFGAIDQALAAGTIDLDTALEYKMFALFHDPRLPATYQGDDSDVAESDVFDQIYDNWPNLQADTQTTLLPFLTPPVYRGSWASPTGAGKLPLFGNVTCQQPELDVNWASLPVNGAGHFKVWYDQRLALGGNQASQVSTALEQEVWPRLIDDLGLPSPISDGLNNGCNGGDGRIDVYLVDMASAGQVGTDYGEAMATEITTKHHSAFMMVNRNKTMDEIKGTLAHEVMHTVQWSYPVAAFSLSSYDWLKEATAHWAIDKVYPTQIGNFEQRKAPFYLTTFNLSLDDPGTNKNRPYGTYLFFLFLARSQRPTLIKDIWTATTSQSDQLKAVDTAIPGGFATQWPKFAKALWNQDPVDDFKRWDDWNMTPEPDLTATAALSGAPRGEFKLEGNMKHLTIQYAHFRFGDATVRSVAFLSHLFATTPIPGQHVSVQAFVKKVGSIWEWQDWTGGGFENAIKPFCQDVLAERLDELVIVITNDSPTSDITGLPLSPTLSASNVGCWRYSGNADYVQDARTADGSTSHVEADGTITLERFRPSGAPVPVGTETFVVKTGAISGNGTTVVGPCTTTGVGAGDLSPGPESGDVTVPLDLDLGAGFNGRHASGTGSGTVQITTTMVCGTSTISVTGPGSFQYMQIPIEAVTTVKPDGNLMGSFTRQLTTPFSGTETMTWNLHPDRE